MITITEIDRFNNTLNMFGLSADEKPIDIFRFYDVNYKIKNASTFYEMDTKKAYIYDEENHKWLEM